MNDDAAAPQSPSEPSAPPPARQSGWKFAVGVVGGFVLNFVGLGCCAAVTGQFVVLYPIAVLVAGILCLRKPDFRGLGIGLLLGLGTGLLLLALCFAIVGGVGIK